MKKSFQVTCPHCQKKFEYYSSEFRPFCCEKCRMIDLGHWLSESYTVPASKISPEEADQLERIIHDKEEDQSNEDT